MSWHFSLGLEADYWRDRFSAGAQSAQSSSTGTDGPSLCFDSQTGVYRDSPSGTILGRSTACHGEDVLTWYREAFPARRIPRQLEAKTSRMISGRKCGGSWQRQLPGTYLPRTLHAMPSTPRQTTLKRWVTKPAALPFRRATWVQITSGNDIGYVHTPTTKANYAASSMQKWPACRNFVRAFGAPTPEVHEWLMDWPIGWSDLRPLETGRWQSWLQRHGD